MERNNILWLVLSAFLLLMLGTTIGLAETVKNAACMANMTSCNGTCIDTRYDLRNCGSCGTMCPPGQHCLGGKCVCPMNLTPCDGVCIDTSTDEMHCGACGQVCPPGTVCIGGGCWPSGSYGSAEPEAEPAVNPKTSAPPESEAAVNPKTSAPPESEAAVNPNASAAPESEAPVNPNPSAAPESEQPATGWPRT